MKATFASMFNPIGRVLARKSVQQATVICAVFGSLIGGGIYTARNTDLFNSKPPEIISRSDNITGAASLKDDDPVKNFAKTGVGQVLFTGAGKDSCKRTLFDNKTGSYRVVADMYCGNDPEHTVDDKKSEQLNSMRRAFSN